MNKRSFLKRAGLLTGLAVLNPLKLLGLFKPKPALSMETMKAAFDEVSDGIYFATPEPMTKMYILDKYDPKQWVSVED